MRVMVDANIIISKVHLLITGDKDFDEIMLDTPKIIKPREYADKYFDIPTSS